MNGIGTAPLRKPLIDLTKLCCSFQFIMIFMLDSQKHQPHTNLKIKIFRIRGIWPNSVTVFNLHWSILGSWCSANSWGHRYVCHQMFSRQTGKRYLAIWKVFLGSEKYSWKFFVLHSSISEVQDAEGKLLKVSETKDTMVENAWCAELSLGNWKNLILYL